MRALRKTKTHIHFITLFALAAALAAFVCSLLAQSHAARIGFGLAQFVMLAGYVGYLVGRHAWQMRRKEAIFQSLPMNVYVFDKDRKILHISSDYSDMKDAAHTDDIDAEFSAFCEKSIPTVMGGEDLSLEYEFRGVWRRGIMKKAPPEFFGKDAFMITTVDVSDLSVARNVQKETADQLKDANRFLRVFIDNMPSGIFIKNYSDGGKYVLANKYFQERIVGSAEDIVGKTDYDLLELDVAQDCNGNELQVLATEGQVMDFFEDVRTLSGLELRGHTINVAQRVENGDLYLFGICSDMTEIIESQEREKLHSQQLRTLSNFLGTAMLSSTPKGLFGDVLRFVGESLRADHCFVFRYDPTDKSIRPLSQWCSDDVYFKSDDELPKISPDIDAWIDKLSKNELIVSEDMEAEHTGEFANLDQIEAANGIKSLLASGILKNGKLLGFVSIEFRKNKHKFTESDYYLVQMVSHILEFALERFEHLKQLEEGETLRRLLLDSVDIPIMLWDPNLKLVNANSAAAKFAGADEATLLANPCDKVICKGMFNPRSCPVRRCLDEGRVVTNDISFDGKDFHVTITPIFDAEKKVMFAIESIIEMTEFNAGKRQLVRSMEQAQASNKAKSYFIATMSQELRTPLNAVIGYTDLTQDPKLSHDERLHNLKNINFAANTLLSLINDVLDLSKLESEQLEIVKSPLDLRKLAEEFEGIFKFAAKKKGIALSVQVEGHMPIVMLDMLRLKQVLMNLIGNAIKFTHTGGVHVSFALQPTAANVGEVHISVQDTGIGITPEFAEKIFSPFEQDNGVRVRGRSGHEGTGLGLTISKRLLERMGGELSYDSKLGIGSEFKVVLRDVEICPEGTVLLPEEGTRPAAPIVPKKGLCLMIVDDIMLNLKVLRKMLENFDATVIECLSAKEALEKLESAIPDAILTDLWMPEMSGEELAKAVKANPRTAKIPIMAITADTNLQDPDHVYDGILFKPITIKAVAEKLDALMSQAASE